MSASEDEVTDIIETVGLDSAPADAALITVLPQEAAAAAATARVSDGQALSSFREEWKAELGTTSKAPVPAGMHSYSFNPKPRPSNLMTMGRARVRSSSAESAGASADVPVLLRSGAGLGEDGHQLAAVAPAGVDLDGGHGELDEAMLETLSTSGTASFAGVGRTTGDVNDLPESNSSDEDGSGGGGGGGGGAKDSGGNGAGTGDSGSTGSNGGAKVNTAAAAASKMSKKTTEALRMFNAAIAMESTGRINEALEMYILASKLDPNIEHVAYEIDRKADAADKLAKKARGGGSTSSSGGGGASGASTAASAGGVHGGGGDVLAELRSPGLQFPIEPTLPTTRGHIRDLPHELLMAVMVPSCLPSMDIRQVGKLARVCKRFYVTLIDQEIWRRLACILWLGTNNKLGTFLNWEKMCHQRPRIHFHGVYITRYAYSRKGEQTIGQYYRPSHLVEYYRFLRFFPNGGVVAVTSAEQPHVVVPRLKHPKQLSKKEKIGLTLFSGQYVFDGERVIVNVGQRIDSSTVATFSTQLLIGKRKGTQSMKLVWERHRGGTKRDKQLPMMNDYDLTGFLPYTFSPIRNLPVDSFNPKVVFGIEGKVGA